MNHALDGARIKIDRAKEHLDSLKGEIQRYIDCKPFEVPLEVKGDMTRTCRPLVLRLEPPLRLSTIIGDCVTNLRASLDYIAWELATKYAATPLKSGQQKRVQFPITLTQQDFSKVSGTADHLRNVCNIPAAALTLIESVQPYHAGYELLKHLNDLANEDKHRLPVLTACHPETLSILVDGKKISSAFPAVSHTLGVNPVAHSGQWAVAPEKRRPVKVEGHVTVWVPLKNPAMPQGDVDGVLEDMLNCVASIVPQFDVFF
jgi:hypothetical protein